MEAKDTKVLIDEFLATNLALKFDVAKSDRGD